MDLAVRGALRALASIRPCVARQVFALKKACLCVAEKGTSGLAAAALPGVWRGLGGQRMPRRICFQSPLLIDA